MFLFDSKILVLLAGAGIAMITMIQTEDEIILDLKEYFSDYQYGCFVIRDLESGVTERYNPNLCRQQFTPASTFKIPHALIALETGVHRDMNSIIKWDGQQRWNSSWNRDHNLFSAIQESVVWYFQETAERIGSERMGDWLNKLEYGNQDITGGLNKFWLSSSLRISPDEQVKFLQRFASGDLPVSKDNIEAVKTALSLSGEGYSGVFGKTGTGVFENGIRIGWYVGFINQGVTRKVFALNIFGNKGVSGQVAKKLALKILSQHFKLIEFSH